MISLGAVTAVYERVKVTSAPSVSSLRCSIGGSSRSESGLRTNCLSAAGVPTLELIVTNTKRKAVFNNGEIIVVVGGGGGIFVAGVIVDYLLVTDGVN